MTFIEMECGKLLAIDPSLKSMGWAVFSGADQLDEYGLFEGMGEGILDIATEFAYSGFQDMRIKWAIIENPQVRGGKTGEAALRSGSILKLATLVGAIGGILRSWDITVYLVTPMKWKGNLPKRVTIKRVNRQHHLDLREIRGEHDQADAIALGDWWWKKIHPNSSL